MTTYKNVVCYKCRIPIMVASHDVGERNYCQTCAWDKLMWDNPTPKKIGKDE